MNVMAPVPPDSPLMIAWELYSATEAYANTRRWALHDQHVDGSLWAAFHEGWRCHGGWSPISFNETESLATEPDTNAIDADPAFDMALRKLESLIAGIQHSTTRADARDALDTVLASRSTRPEPIQAANVTEGILKAETGEARMSEIKPALSPEEWRDVMSGHWLNLPDSTWDDVARATDECQHGAAAIALHGQPFGFTWDDVDRLRSLDYMNLDQHEDGPTLASIAGRIEALLPPRVGDADE
jgi:hypothetical protein